MMVVTYLTLTSNFDRKLSKVPGLHSYQTSVNSLEKDCVTFSAKIDSVNLISKVFLWNFQVIKSISFKERLLYLVLSRFVEFFEPNNFAFVQYFRTLFGKNNNTLILKCFIMEEAPWIHHREMWNIIPACFFIEIRVQWIRLQCGDLNISKSRLRKMTSNTWFNSVFFYNVVHKYIQTIRCQSNKQ